MLAYQHGYHAGNLADVHKHAALAWCLDYLTRKDKPLSYIETHAGRGIYDLSSAEAEKTKEAAKGILSVEQWFGADHPYARAVRATRAAHGGTIYPGSPAIAQQLLRPNDKLHLAELHPQEVAALRRAIPAANIVQQDGLQFALSFTPPVPRRGLMLIDPSYEGASDYPKIPGFLSKLHKKWNVGCIILWYPVLRAGLEKPMVHSIRASLPDALFHEVRFPPAQDSHRMIGSGLCVINPPWTLDEQLAHLSALFQTLQS